MISRFSSIGLVAAALTPVAFAQNTGEVDMKAAIGSFKINSPGKENARGRIQMSFRGTLLLVNYTGATPVITGTIKKEYDNQAKKRMVFHGQGTVTVDGNFRALQWFGKDLTMKWIGMGICRIYGEFDSTGKTGTYQVKGDLLRYWGSGGMTFTLPIPNSEPAVKPKIKRNGG
jgi:hypothetical protein